MKKDFFCTGFYIINTIFFIRLQFVWAKTPGMFSIPQTVRLALMNNADIPALSALNNMMWCVGFTLSVTLTLYFGLTCFLNQSGRIRVNPQRGRIKAESEENQGQTRKRIRVKPKNRKSSNQGQT